MTLAKTTPDDEARRLKLRVIVKTMLAIAALAIVFVFVTFFFSGSDERPRLPTLRVDISDLSPGDSKRVLWQSRPVVILRRTPATVAALQSAEATRAGRLRDPDSSRSEQPEALRGPTRSLDPEWFVAIALGTDQGCPVSAHTLTNAEPGFIDECRGSEYDAAGRVLSGQYADRNLAVPRYGIETIDGRLHAVLGR